MQTMHSAARFARCINWPITIVS